MRRITALIVIVVLFANVKTYSQSFNRGNSTAIIEPYHLAITYYKTTNLIFPYAIKSVDRGSQDVLAQKAKSVENILLVKAGTEYFKQTNLSVITSDGKLYSFILDYTPNPSILNLAFTDSINTESAISFDQSEVNEKELLATCALVKNKKRMFHNIKDKSYEVELQLTGLYIKNNVIYCRTDLKNHSYISYDIDMFRFCIKDKKTYKRTASQEIDIKPVFVYGDTTGVKDRSKSVLVFALPKFTIPSKQYLYMQFMEKNGGRNLSLSVRNRTIVKAKNIER